jgi:hypothetical protein
MKKNVCRREYDFALILSRVSDLTSEVEDALFSAGCDDATFSIQYGYLYAEFSREAASMKDALLSAIRDVQKSKLGLEAVRVDECALVTPAEIGRKTGRSRQMIHQYITGQRGPGNFPPPECHLAEGSPLWSWCTVSRWLAENNLIRPEEFVNVEAVAAVNLYLELARQQKQHPNWTKEIGELLGA